VNAPLGGQATSAPAPSSPASSFVPSGFLPSATPVAPGVAQPDNFWTRPVWAGAPIKGWQAVFGGVASLALAFGIVSAVRR
jgi:hypothetical protein